MLFVRFTDIPKEAFPNYERLPYEEALLLSTQVHQEAQQANERFASEFRIFDDADQLVYKGTFQFGDPTYPNLYLQLKDRIPRIRIRKEDATKKILLLENLERLTPESYKTMMTSAIQQQPDATHVSRLRRGQRRLVYGVSGISLLLLGALSIVQLVQPDPPSGVQAETSDWQPLYEAALTGDTGPLVERLEKRKIQSMSRRSSCSRNDSRPIVRIRYKPSKPFIRRTKERSTLLSCRKTINVPSPLRASR